jgi:serine/threonine-protein kinase
MRVGYLTADATPWAEVSLNGRVLDRTPFVRYPVPAGRHSLEFRGPDGVVRRQSVTVTAGQTVSVRVDFGAPKELPPQRP